MGFFENKVLAGFLGPKENPCSNRCKKKSCMGVRVERKKEENAEGGKGKDLVSLHLLLFQPMKNCMRFNEILSVYECTL